MQETQRLNELMRRIWELYEARHPSRADWADWLFANHVFVVAYTADELAGRYGADRELAAAAGMLHDVADAVMNRFDPNHEKESLRMARELLEVSGFSAPEIKLVVEDAIRFHGCHDEGMYPAFLEGKVMAAADAIVHLTSNFYSFGVERMRAGNKTADDIRAWALPKMSRDLNDKIFDAALREEVRPDFERLQRFFLSLQ